MKKIFLSYTSLCNDLFNNKVNESDLVDSYFYFGCTKEHVFRDIKVDQGELGFMTKDIGIINSIHSIITRQVSLAEKENRIVWRRSIEDKDTIAKVGDMLNCDKAKEDMLYQFSINGGYLGRYKLKQIIEEFTDFKCYGV